MKKLFFIAVSCLAGLWILCAAALAVAGCSDQVGKADIALVLGSKVELDGSPSPRLRARLDKTLELYNGGYFQKVIVSGGIGKEGYDEAAVMAEYLEKKGVPGSSIFRDNKGNNTFESAKETAVLCAAHGLKSVFIVSQYFHIPRAKLALQRFGIGEIRHAHAHYAEWLREPYSITRELAGCVSYRFKSYALPAKPAGGQ